MPKDYSIKIHKQLHESLDELVACWLNGGKYPDMRLPSDISLMEFMKWAYQQTIDPECFHANEEVRHDNN